MGKDDLSDLDSDDEYDEFGNEKTHEKKGYCHFNDDGSNKTFSISLFGHDLNIEQDPASRILGHGAVVWDAAVIFSKYMEHDPKRFSADLLHGRSCIELGSGCGLGGISLMMKGARVTLTDLQKVTESLTSVNANRIFSQLNSKGQGALPKPIVPPSIFALDWTDFNSFEESGGLANGTYDIVLLTDCVFSVTLAIPLVDCIKKLCSSHSIIYCCHEIRDEEANKHFLEEFSKFFTFKRIPRYKLHPTYTNDLVELIIGKPIRASKNEKQGAY
jgi:predicted nicotinamide N-methyase